MIFRLRPLTADEGRLRQQTHGIFTPAAEFIRPDTGTEVTDRTRQKLIGLLAVFRDFHPVSRCGEHLYLYVGNQDPQVRPAGQYRGGYRVAYRQ